jgi:hypothetical protein
MNVRSIRRLYRSLVLAKIPPSREACPSVAALRAAFEETTKGEIKDGIVDHISGCAECAREFAFIRELRGEEEWLASALWKASRRPRRSDLTLIRPIWAGVLGVAMIGLLLSGLVVFSPRMDGEGPRSKASIAPETIAPAGRMASTSSLTFQWKPISEARAYIIEVYDASLRLMWESPSVESASLVLPEIVENKLGRGEDYFWSVTAVLAEDGISESRLQWFAIDR